jgi:hypothetical protein
MPCAIGLRAHSGWAVAVGVASAAPGKPPDVVLRERIDLTDPRLVGSKAPYHAAEKLPLEEAAAFLARCQTASRGLARTALERVVERLREEGRAPARCGLLLAAARSLPDLRSTLASHAWIHGGDGEHFRGALADAAAACGLDVRRVRERDVAESLSGSAESVDDYLARQRRLLGPPWARDQKLAALAAWFALRN